MKYKQIATSFLLLDGITLNVEYGLSDTESNRTNFSSIKSKLYKKIIHPSYTIRYIKEKL